jgi:hypothetical protein
MLVEAAAKGAIGNANDLSQHRDTDVRLHNPQPKPRHALHKPGSPNRHPVASPGTPLHAGSAATRSLRPAYLQ